MLECFQPPKGVRVADVNYFPRRSLPMGGCSSEVGGERREPEGRPDMSPQPTSVVGVGDPLRRALASPGRVRHEDAVRAAPEILILVENLSVPFDRRVWMEATTLREAGYGVSVICPRSDGRPFYEQLEGVRIYRYPLPSLEGMVGHLVEYAIALPVTFVLSCLVYARHGVDAIQGANPPDLFFLVAAPVRLLGVKFVFDHHDLTPEICDSRWHGWRRVVLRRLCLWAERATFRVADRVIATNESYRQVAVGRGGVPAERVAVVRSGPRLAQFRPVPPVPAFKNGRPYLVAYLGVMGPNDGIDQLLAAIAHLVHIRGRRDIEFVLIGSGDLQPKMVSCCRALGLEDCVSFTGRIPDDEVIRYLSTADLCVAPDPKDALNDVSSMNKIVEYMALGKPIVAFDLREARVSAGEGAVYATPNDASALGERIVELLADPERRRRMGEIGRARFETTLAWEHQRGALLAVYRSLFPAPQGGAGNAARREPP